MGVARRSLVHILARQRSRVGDALSLDKLDDAVVIAAGMNGRNAPTR